jgi:hypothetical protein
LEPPRSICPGCYLSHRIPPRRKSISLGFLAEGRFGFRGKIADAAACESAGGHFIPQAFGWMVHVYPFNGDDLKAAFGTSVPMPPAN